VDNRTVLHLPERNIMTKLVAVLGILLGAGATILSVLVAFGVNITPDQHTALLAAGGVLLTILGLWAHPDIPVGPSTK
jgi:hypothetical protein